MGKESPDEAGSVDQKHGAAWNRWFTDHEQLARNELVKIYLPFARTVAAKVYNLRNSDGIEFDDYMQLATVGLIEAIEKFDPTQNAKFETYASYRVKGAILNGLEKGSERLAQGVYRKRYLRDRAASIERGFAREDDSGLFREMVDAAIGMALGYMLEDSELAWQAEESEDNPYKRLEVSRLKRRLRVIVDQLPEKEGQVVSLHYFEHRNFSDIAEIMNLTKGRVSQLHSHALRLIREQYEEASGFNVRY